MICTMSSLSFLTVIARLQGPQPAAALKNNVCKHQQQNCRCNNSSSASCHHATCRGQQQVTSDYARSGESVKGSIAYTAGYSQYSQSMCSCGTPKGQHNHSVTTFHALQLTLPDETARLCIQQTSHTCTPRSSAGRSCGRLLSSLLTC
jgi:hypothetical protein